MVPYRVPDPIKIYRFFDQKTTLPVYDVDDKTFDLTEYLQDVSLCELLIRRRSFTAIETGDDITPADSIFPTYSLGEGIMRLMVSLENNNVSKNGLVINLNKKQTGWLNPEYFYMFELFVDMMEESTPNIDSDSRELLAFGTITLINSSPYPGFEDSEVNGVIDGIE